MQRGALDFAKGLGEVYVDGKPHVRLSKKQVLRSGYFDYSPTGLLALGCFDGLREQVAPLSRLLPA
jgi:hypothetical protein